MTSREYGFPGFLAGLFTRMYGLSSNDLDSPNIGILSLGTFLNVAQRNSNVRAWTADAPYAWLDPCPRALGARLDVLPS